VSAPGQVPPFSMASGIAVHPVTGRLSEVPAAGAKGGRARGEGRRRARGRGETAGLVRLPTDEEGSGSD
jgi:hypothetical protein